MRTLTPMNALATIAASVVLAAAAAYGVVQATAPAAPVATEGLPELRQAVADLRGENAALRSQLAELANAPHPAQATPVAERSAAPVSDAQIAAAIEAYLAKRGDAGVLAAAASGTAGKAATFDVATEFELLVGKNFWNNPDAWKRAFAAGRMDEVVKQFEALAKANPNDTTAQMNLANAYLAYVQMDPTKWQNSMKADGVFDKVLALDDNHWEARFTKAVSYTFYPDFLGKKKDAIAQFEKLVEQQASRPAQPYEAQTYLYLGNLLEQRDPAKAREIWQKGAQRHPDSEELRKKLGG